MFLRLVAARPILLRAIDLDRCAVSGFYRILLAAALRIRFARGIRAVQALPGGRQLILHIVFEKRYFTEFTFTS